MCVKTQHMLSILLKCNRPSVDICVACTFSFSWHVLFCNSCFAYWLSCSLACLVCFGKLHDLLHLLRFLCLPSWLGVLAACMRTLFALLFLLCSLCWFAVLAWVLTPPVVLCCNLPNCPYTIFCVFPGFSTKRTKLHKLIPTREIPLQKVSVTQKGPNRRLNIPYVSAYVCTWVR